MQFKSRLIERGAILILATILVIGTAVAHAAAVSIDTFSSTANHNVVALCDNSSPGETADGFRNDATAIGGQRDFFILCMNGDGIANFSTSTSSGTLSFSQGAGVAAIGSVAWDGTDGDGTTVDPTGLGGVDLTDSNTNVGIHLLVLRSDLGIPIIVRIYTDDLADYEEYQLDVPAGINAGSFVSFVLPFDDFVSQGNGADFANVGAITITFDGTADADADIIIDLIEATDATHDFGDAPASYDMGGTNPAQHLLGTGLRLGPSLSAEAGKRGTSATEDTFDDGVVRLTDWEAGQSATLQITVRGCTGTCRLNGWVDWDKDGDFTTAGDQIFSDVAVTNATTTLNFMVPAGANVTDNSLYARFRLCSSVDDCDTPLDESADGEVEDYFWGFGPLAVTMNSVSTGLVASGGPVVATLAILLLVAASVVVVRRKH